MTSSRPAARCSSIALAAPGSSMPTSSSAASRMACVDRGDAPPVGSSTRQPGGLHHQPVLAELLVELGEHVDQRQVVAAAETVFRKMLAEHGRGRRCDQCPIEIEHGKRTARHRREPTWISSGRGRRQRCRRLRWRRKGAHALNDTVTRLTIRIGDHSPADRDLSAVTDHGIEPDSERVERPGRHEFGKRDPALLEQCHHEDRWPPRRRWHDRSAMRPMRPGRRMPSRAGQAPVNVSNPRGSPSALAGRC